MLGGKFGGGSNIAILQIPSEEIRGQGHTLLCPSETEIITFGKHPKSFFHHLAKGWVRAWIPPKASWAHRGAQVTQPPPGLHTGKTRSSLLQV
jgi:hypothetical protein